MGAHHCARYRSGRRSLRAPAAFVAVFLLGIPPAAADDRVLCRSETASPDVAIAACSALLGSPFGRGRDRAVILASRGIHWRHKGDLDRAIADYDDALRIDPNSASIYNNRGVVWRHKGNVDQAIADYDQAIRIDRNYALAYRNRGTAFVERGERERAIADFSEAIRLNPRDFDAYFQRGFMRRQRGNLDGALSDYGEAIRLNPRLSVAYNNRGAIWRTKHEFDRAIADFTEAIRVDPSYLAAFTGRGLAYESKGERERARADFNAALALPRKHDNSRWAQDTARARLALLAPATSAPPTAAATPAPSPAGTAPSLAMSSAAAPSPGHVLPRPAALPPAPPRVKPQPVATRPTEAPSVAPLRPAPPAAASPAAKPTAARLALVIGNGAYTNAPALPNPTSDARSIAQGLREMGFDVIEAIDLDHAAMDRAILDFLRKAAAAQMALLFYAGHGVQIDGKNYLVPVDAKQVTRETAGFELIDVDRVLAGLDDEARANVIILDACRDNPIDNQLVMSRSSARGGGLAAYANVGSGMLIAFATAPGKTAIDGTGEHSPFTAALLKHMRTPRLEVNQMLTRVRIDVVAATEKKQVPWVNSSLLGEVYLVADQRTQAGN